MGDSRSSRAHLRRRLAGRGPGDRRVWLGLLIAALAVAGLTACVGGPTTGPIKPVQVVTGPAPAQTADPALVKAAGDDALAAYKGYFQAYVNAGEHQAWNSKTIDKYAADPARLQAHLSLRDQSEAHIVFQGKPVSTPVVTVVNVDRSPNSVTIADCIDATNWQKFDTKADKLIAVTPQRYGVTALVVDYGSDWLVQQVTTSGAPC